MAILLRRYPRVSAVCLALASIGLATPEASALGWHHHKTVVTSNSQAILVPMAPATGGGQVLVQSLMAPTVQTSALTLQTQALAAPLAATTYTYALVPQALVVNNQAASGCDSSGASSSVQQQVGFSTQSAFAAQAVALASQHTALANRLGGQQSVVTLINLIRNELSRGNTNKNDLFNKVIQLITGSLLGGAGFNDGQLVINLINDVLRIFGGGGGGGGGNGQTITVTIPPFDVTVNAGDGTTPATPAGGPSAGGTPPPLIQLNQAVQAQAAQTQGLANDLKTLQADLELIKKDLKALTDASKK